MGKILKLLGIVAGAGLALIVLVMIGLVLFFDPNDYKTEISAAVEQATGRQLTLEGDLELDVFPRLRITIGAAELANAAGFADEPFASIEGAGLAVGLLPLLSRRIEIDEARLEGLVLNLARDGQGRSNWQDMGGAGAPEPASPTGEDSSGDAALELNVDAVVISQAEINWSDEVAGSQWQLGDFNLDAAGFGPGTAFPLSMDFSLTGDEVSVAVTASMEATLGLADDRYRLEDLEIEIVGEGPAWPGGQGEVDLSFGAFEADLQAETLSLEDLALEILGLTVTGTLTGRQLFGDLSLAGEVEFEEFDPQALLEIFDVELETADAGVLRRASITAELAYDANRTMLEAVELVLDDSRLSGQLGLVGDSVRFDLSVDSIDIDRYLPPASDAATEEAGSLDEVDLPLEALRTLSAAGQMTIGAARFAGLTLSDVEFSFAADDGLVSMEPSASLYDGTYDGELTIRVTGDTASLSIEQRLTGIDAMPLGQDLMDGELVSGTVNARLNLTAMGSNLGEIRRQLDGDVTFALTDGAWEGVDMWYELRRARALFDQAPTPARDGPARTPFSEVSASGVLEDGVLTNRDLSADLEFMTVTGSGTVNFVTDAMDFDLVAQFVDGPILQSDPAMVDLAGDELPLKVSGSPSSPSVLPDFGAMVRAEVEEAIEERLDEERESLQERLEDRLRGLFN
ncbi:MAG: AsmA family protein [Gammaproteobacteria bacterium]